MTFKKPFHFKSLNQIKEKYFATKDLELKKHNARTNEDLPWRRCFQMNFIEAVLNSLEKDENSPLDQTPNLNLDAEKISMIGAAVIRLQKLIIAEQEYGETKGNAQVGLIGWGINWFKSKITSKDNSFMYMHNDEIIEDKKSLDTNEEGEENEFEDSNNNYSPEEQANSDSINFIAYENQCLLELRNYLFATDNFFINKPDKTLTKKEVIDFISKHISLINENQLPFKLPSHLPSSIQPRDDERDYPQRGFNEVQMIKILHDKQHANLKLNKVNTIDKTHYLHVMNKQKDETKKQNEQVCKDVENFSNLLNHKTLIDKAHPLYLYRKQVDFEEKRRYELRKAKERTKILRENEKQGTIPQAPPNTPILPPRRRY